MNKEELHDFIARNEPNICQIVAYKDDEIVYEDTWNGYKRDDAVHIMSATKSIVSLLYGIALDKGFIKSIDDKVLTYFPDYQVKRGEKTVYDVTIRHLLTMRAPYKGKGDPWTKVCSSDNWTYASLDFLGGRKGITGEFDYRTVCLHILSGILYSASGMRPVDFANEFLFKPLNIPRHTGYYAETALEHKEFTLDKGPKENIWFSDNQDIATPGYGLCMSAEDMSKIGQLCLDKGRYKGQRIISSEWIDEMTVPVPVEDKWFKGMHYGYLWWIINTDKKIYAAIGNSGNIVYINPVENIVISITSYFKPTVFDRVEFIEEEILPILLG